VQALIVSYASKIAAGLAAPLIAIIFLPKSENLRPRSRRLILWLVSLIQISLLFAFAYLAWRVPGESTTTAISDWIVALVAGLGAAVPLWIKREKSPGDLVIKV
jgi:thiol:disulfide interchange protein